MVDKWRAHTRTLPDGTPVVFVQVSVQRTIPITQAFFENIRGRMLESGLQEAVELVDTAFKLQQDQRQYAAVQWSDLTSHTLQLQPFSSVISALEGRPFFRIEGDARAGYNGVFCTADREFTVALTEENIPAIKGELQQLHDDAKASGEDSLAELCDQVGDRIHGLEEVCRTLRELREAQKAVDAQTQKQMRDIENAAGFDRRPEIMRGDDIDRVERAMRTA